MSFKRFGEISRRVVAGFGLAALAALVTSFVANADGAAAVADFDPEAYSPGQGVEVTITVTPGAACTVYAVEDTPPAGWTVAGISDSGLYDEVNGKVKWGPFFDNQNRTLIYTATAPPGESGSRTFAGIASFDGTSIEIGGARTIANYGGVGAYV